MAARGTGLSRRFKARSRVKTARRRPGRCRPYGGDRGFAGLDSTPPRGRSSAGRASASQADSNQRARFRNNAAVAQLVERELPKLEVAGSRPVRRFLQMLVRLSAGRRGVSSQLGLGQAAAFRPERARDQRRRWLLVAETKQAPPPSSSVRLYSLAPSRR